MAEFVVAASECEAGRLHLWPEAGVLEMQSADGRTGDTLAGELVCTGLLNPAMPLIRYRTGDRGSLAPAGQRCDCGRTLPIVETIDGRVDDMFYTVDGRRVGRIDPVFKTSLAVREAQVVQESLERIRVRFVPGPGFTGATGHLIAERIRQRLGSVQVVLEPLESIPRGAHGKFRGAICAIPQSELGAITRV
jgi:phenylacetate-CoA ligase